MLPVLTDCKTVSEIHEQNMLIQKAATDLVAEPIVQEGYMRSGQSPATAFINVNSMARKRLHAIFPAADWKEPLMERMLVEARHICAQCIHLKYVCRENRVPYNHLKDATIRIQKMIRDKFVSYGEYVAKLRNEEQPPKALEELDHD